MPIRDITFAAGAAVLIYLLLAVLTGCQHVASPLPTFELEFTARTDRGRPLPGVTVAIRGQPAGTTNELGVVGASVRVREGTKLRVAADCPVGYRDAQLPDTVSMRRFRTVAGVEAEATNNRLHIAISCMPAERTAILVVRAREQGGLPVVVDGNVRGHTDASGVAHIHLRREPYRDLRVVLDTNEKPRLRPQNPAISFELEDTDEIFVFDQNFDELKEPKRRRHRRKPEPEPEPEPPRPVRPIKIQ